MTDTQGMQAVANKVFDIKELREMILLELPMQDIIRLQRTNRAWHSSVTDKRAAPLQRKLYYRTDPTIDAISMPLSSSLQDLIVRLRLLEATDINPLFAITHPIWASSTDYPWHLRYLRRFSCSSGGKAVPCVELHFTLNDQFCSRYKALQLYRQEARTGSWNNMLVSQTPSTYIYVELNGSWRYRRNRRNEIFLSPGSTMGDVFQWLEKTYMKTVGSEKWRKYVATRKATLRKNVL